MALRFLYGVPEGLAVCILRRGMKRQENFGMGHAAFAGVIAGLAIILAEQLFTGTIGGRGDGGLSRTPLNLCCVEMIKSDSQSPPDCSAAL